MGATSWTEMSVAETPYVEGTGTATGDLFALFIFESAGGIVQTPYTEMSVSETAHTEMSVAPTSWTEQTL